MLEPGFTLVELIAVIAVIALLSGMVVAVGGFAQLRAATSRTETTVNSLCAALECYRADWGVYPVDSVNQTLRRYAGNRPPERVVQNPYSNTGGINPAMSLWYHLEQAMLDLGRRPYISYKLDQLVDDDHDLTYGAADGFGRHLNYKSNNPAGYSFSAAQGTDPRYAPRHNHDSFDLCSYGQDRTTWKDYDPVKHTGKTFSPAELNANYFNGPFERLGQLAGLPHCFGGEGNDDVNNWQQR